MCDCDSINMIPGIPDEVTLVFNPMKAVTVTGAVVTGFGTSNLVTTSYNKAQLKAGKEPWNVTNGGLVKVILGAGTVWGALSYAPENLMLEGIGLGVGMAASGTLDILGDNLPEEVSETVTDFLGIDAVPSDPMNGIPVNQPGLPRGRQPLPNRQPVRQRNSTTSLAL